MSAIVINLVGMPGSGKSTLCARARTTGYGAYYMGSMLEEACLAAGLPSTYANKMMMAFNQDASLVDSAIPRIAALAASHDVVLVDSVRTRIEHFTIASAFKNSLLVGVVIDQATRVARLLRRDGSGHRSIAARDEAELGIKPDSGGRLFEVGILLATCDHYVLNCGNDDLLLPQLQRIIRERRHQADPWRDSSHPPLAQTAALAPIGGT